MSLSIGISIFMGEYMVRNTNETELNLDTLKGRLAFAIKTIGPSKVEKLTSISRAQVSRIANQHASTTLESAAEIAMATGFELKWIALGTGPMRVDDDLWEHTNKFIKVKPLDPNQKIDISFESEYLANELDAKPEECVVWEIDYKINLKNLNKGHTVLIHKTKTFTGLILVETHGQKRIVFSKLNINGNLSIEMEEGQQQEIKKAEIENLNIIGEVIWTGGQY
jgi:hypothetical protein